MKQVKWLRVSLLLMLALGLAIPALAQVELYDSQEPGSVIVFPKFITGKTAAGDPRSEFEISIVCPKNPDGTPGTCVEGTKVKLRAHWVCPADQDPENKFICKETDFDLYGPDVYLGDGRGGWKASSMGLKVLKVAAPGIALGDLDQDGHLDLIAAGNVTGELRSGYGLFWFRGDGKGGWQLVPESGLPPQGLSIPWGVTLADLDRDGALEIIALHGGREGSLTIWKRP